ncbi:MAG: aldehyde dehydrogenase family protein, partial [Tissierellales bacterium]|nr:aldehyde dehydrogenase family protein [Tissierellales bacterium]
MEKYTNLNLNYINGEWKDGSGDKKIIDNNPYSGEEIAAFKVATLEDIDEAYKGAEEKQKSWGNTNA